MKKTAFFLLPVLMFCALTEADASADKPTDTASSDTHKDPTDTAASDAQKKPTDTVSTDAQQSVPSGGTPSAPLHCGPETVETVLESEGVYTSRTQHFELWAQASKDEAEEMARMLEAAYSAFQAYFEATPTLAAGERLRARFYASRSTWKTAVEKVSESPKDTTVGVFVHSNENETVYLYKQPSPFYSHLVLLHEATHQFHFFARKKSGGIPPWYLEGVADYLARHDWDSKCLRLGVNPLQSMEDQSRLALKALDTIHVSDIVKDLTYDEFQRIQASYALSSMLFQFLENGDNGVHKSALKAFRDASDAGRKPSFAEFFGDPAEIERKLKAWLPSVQEPLSSQFIYFWGPHAIIGEPEDYALSYWSHVGPHALTGGAGGLGHLSLAITKMRVTHFEAQYDLPKVKPWQVGVVLGYLDDDNFKLLLTSSDGQIRTFSRHNGTIKLYNVASTSNATQLDTGHIAIDFGTDETVTVAMDGAAPVRFTVLLPQRSGLAVFNSHVHFHDIAWR